MPDLNLVRTRWDFLRAIHPLFPFAKSLPTVEGADQGHYGPLSVDDVDSLKNVITMLRTDLRLNIIKQQLLADVDRLAEESSGLGELPLVLELLLEELEDLVDPRVCDIEELEVSFNSDSLFHLLLVNLTEFADIKLSQQSIRCISPAFPGSSRCGNCSGGTTVPSQKIPPTLTTTPIQKTTQALRLLRRGTSLLLTQNRAGAKYIRIRQWHKRLATSGFPRKQARSDRARGKSAILEWFSKNCW